MDLDNKKFATGEEKIREIFFNANVLGVGVIELRWNKRNPYPTSVYGFFVPDMRDVNAGTAELPNYSTSKWVDHKIDFFPAQQDICWGYVYDTEENRDRIAKLLSSGFFSISDKKIAEEITKYAEEHNINLDPAKEPELGVKKTVAERKYESELRRKELEIATLEKNLELLRHQKESAYKEWEQKKDKNNKPLAGVKLDKTKVKKIGEN